MILGESKFNVLLNILLVAVLGFGVFFAFRFFHIFEAEYVNLSLTHHTLLYSAYILILLIALSLVYLRNFFFKKQIEVVFVFGFSFFLLLIAEFGLYITEPKESIFIRHHYLNHVLNPEYIGDEGNKEHNSLGLRGPEIEVPKPKKVYRILTLGGSTTYTSEVPHWRYDFQRVMERELQEHYDYESIEVINGAVGAYTSWDSMLMFILRGVVLEPDMVIVHHGTNDAAARSVTPEKYLRDNSGARHQWGDGPICIHFFCSRVLSKITGVVHSDLDIYADSFQPDTEDRYNEVLGMGVAEALDRNPPIYMEDNYRNIVAIAKDKDIDVLFATWAYTPIEHMATPHMKKAVIEQNEMVKSFSEVPGVLVYDFADEMPTDRKYWKDDNHLNIEGAEMKGVLFAEYVIENGIIDEQINDLKNGQ